MKGAYSPRRASDLLNSLVYVSLNNMLIVERSSTPAPHPIDHERLFPGLLSAPSTSFHPFVLEAFAHSGLPPPQGGKYEYVQSRVLPTTPYVNGYGFPLGGGKVF